MLSGLLGVVLAYCTFVLLAWTGWTTADTAVAWVRDSAVLLLAAVVCGVIAAWLLVGAAGARRLWLVVLVLGLAPTVVTALVASSRY